MVVFSGLRTERRTVAPARVSSRKAKRCRSAHPTSHHLRPHLGCPFPGPDQVGSMLASNGSDGRLGDTGVSCGNPLKLSAHVAQRQSGAFVKRGSGVRVPARAPLPYPTALTPPPSGEM
jgi:hypothetical protein